MRISRARTAALVLTALTATSLTFAGSASATHRPTSTRGQHPTVAVPSPGVRANANPSTDQGAGYWLYPDSVNGLASVSATFKMPAFSCNGADQQWLLPGIWVFSGGVLSEQIDVNFNCNPSTGNLQEGFACLTDGCGSALNVAVGDKMVASIAYTATATIATLKDVTAGTKSQFVGAANTTDDVVLVGDVGPDWFFGGVVTKVPTFTKVSFKTVQVNGEYLRDGPFPTPYNLKTASAVQIITGPIKADGASFDTSFHHI